MSSRARKDNEENIITDPDNAPIERKDKFLKRLAKEKKSQKNGNEFHNCCNVCYDVC